MESRLKNLLPGLAFLLMGGIGLLIIAQSLAPKLVRLSSENSISLENSRARTGRVPPPADASKLQSVYARWKSAFEQGGGLRNLRLALGWSQPLSAEHVRAKGEVTFDLEAGKVALEVWGLGADDAYEVWLIDNQPGPGRSVKPEPGDAMKRLGNLKAYEGGHRFFSTLDPADFEVYRSEMVTQTSTVMLLDLSWSMALRGSFMAAKKVAMALNNLITSQYPRDSFHMVGFSAYARELKTWDLPFVQCDEYMLGTNMQHALMIAEKLLARQPQGTRQILMITDGEPTSHLEHGRAQFSYPPSPITIAETLRAVQRCTRRNITINTFMLDTSYYLKEFVDQMTRINGGRVFYTTPDKLGEYILVDYVQHKRKKLAGRN